MLCLFSKNFFIGSQYVAVLFDVDSKDPTVGMSCPPPDFVENRILNNVKDLLTNKGNIKFKFSIIKGKKKKMVHFVQVCILLMIPYLSEL